MPNEIDQDALESPNLTTLDINKPPVRSIPHKPFPKMVYLHPKDKTKEHRHKIVENTDELEEAQKRGYKTQPHVPVAVEEDFSEEFETSQDDASDNRSDEQDPLDTMTKSQLIDEAKKRKVKIDDKANKEVILNALKSAAAA